MAYRRCSFAKQRRQEEAIWAAWAAIDGEGLGGNDLGGGEE
jgi:hypothetical protein